MKVRPTLGLRLVSQRPGHFKRLIMRHAKNQKCTCGAATDPKPELPAGTRRIKIQPEFVRRVGPNTIVPVILLKGQWLRKIGFECEGHVLIREVDGGLVIRLEGE